MIILTACRVKLQSGTVGVRPGPVAAALIAGDMLFAEQAQNMNGVRRRRIPTPNQGSGIELDLE